MTILEVVFIVLGLFEIVSNAYHIAKSNVNAIGKSARKQHQELPADIPDSHYCCKAVLMFIFGLLFFAAGVSVHFNSAYSSVLLRTVSICFGIYGVIQALIYKTEIKVWPAMIVYAVPLLLVLFVK